MKVDCRAWRGAKSGERIWQEIYKIHKWIMSHKIYDAYIL